MNFMVLFIISILITSLILLIFIVQSFRTHRQSKPLKTIEHSVSFVNPLATSTPSINYSSNRF
jgi:hypothetical protein